MSIVSSLKCGIKSRLRRLDSLEERVVTVREAIRYLLTHRPSVAFSCFVNTADRQQLLITVSRTAALKHLRRLRGRTNAVSLSELWGLLVIG